MDRGNHYEAAFEAYLRWHRLCYVGVDESRRAMLGDERVKSLDFIVYGERQARLLIDVKGRRYPGGKPTDDTRHAHQARPIHRLHTHPQLGFGRSIRIGVFSGYLNT